MKASFTNSMLEDRGLVNLVRLSVDDVSLPLYRIILAGKKYFSGIMDLVIDMATYSKR